MMIRPRKREGERERGQVAPDLDTAAGTVCILMMPSLIFYYRFLVDRVNGSSDFTHFLRLE